MASTCKNTEYTLPFSKWRMCTWWLEQRKTRHKTSNTNMQTCRAVSGILASFSKGFVSEVLLPTTFIFFLVFYSLCVYSFPWMLSHDTGIFNILGFLLRPRLYLYSSSERFLRGVLQGLSHHWPYNKWPQLVSETSWEEPVTSPVLHRFVPNISTTWITPPS